MLYDTSIVRLNIEIRKENGGASIPSARGFQLVAFNLWLLAGFSISHFQVPVICGKVALMYS